MIAVGGEDKASVVLIWGLAFVVSTGGMTSDLAGLANAAAAASGEELVTSPIGGAGKAAALLVCAKLEIGGAGNEALPAGSFD